MLERGALYGAAFHPSRSGHKGQMDNPVQARFVPPVRPRSGDRHFNPFFKPGSKATNPLRRYQAQRLQLQQASV